MELHQHWYWDFCTLLEGWGGSVGPLIGNCPDVDRGGGKTLIHKMLIICLFFFFEPFPKKM